MFDVDRSTITRAIHQIRPLLAARGFATPEGPRLRTLEDVFAYANHRKVALRVHGSEIQVRRPRASRPGRRAFISGKKKQNTIKFTEITGPEGRTLWTGCFRPGRMHDQTAVKGQGIDGLLADYPDVALEMDDGYGGLARDYPAQVTCPPKSPARTRPKPKLNSGAKHGTQVIVTNLRRTRNRRTQSLADTATLDRPTRLSTRDHRRDRRTRLRPRPGHRLNFRDPNANSHTVTSIAHHVVSRVVSAEIRRLSSTGTHSKREIARLVGVSRGTVERRLEVGRVPKYQRSPVGLELRSVRCTGEGAVGGLTADAGNDAGRAGGLVRGVVDVPRESRFFCGWGICRPIPRTGLVLERRVLLTSMLYSPEPVRISRDRAAVR